MSSFTKKLRVSFCPTTKKIDGLSFQNSAFDILINDCLYNGNSFKKAMKKTKVSKSFILKRILVWMEMYFEMARRFPNGLCIVDAVEKVWRFPVLLTGGGNNITVSGLDAHFKLMVNLKKEIDEYKLQHYSVKKIQKIFKKCVQSNFPKILKLVRKPQRKIEKGDRVYLNIAKRQDLKIQDAIRFGAHWEEKSETWYVAKSSSAKSSGRMAILKYGTKRKTLPEIISFHTNRQLAKG
jgi:hypothetical protein